MCKVIGIERLSFKGSDGTEVKGLNLYVSEAIDPKRGQGERADRYFLSEAKIAALDFALAPGQAVDLLYNKFGKVATIKLLDDDSAVID